VGTKNNDRSIVLLIEHIEVDIMITGDATTVTEKKILERYDPAWLEIDVLRVGHHGSLATSTAPDFADAVRPRMAIFSAGLNNTYGHPREEIVTRLAPFTSDTAAKHRVGSWKPATKRSSAFHSTKEEIYATPDSGTIVMKSDGKTFAIQLEK